LPIEAFELRWGSSPVSAPRSYTGRSGNMPGSLVAMSASPTVVRVPES
jgi:hypothetical protein